MEYQKTTKVSKNSKKKKRTFQRQLYKEIPKEIPKERSISPEKKTKIVDNLRLI